MSEHEQQKDEQQTDEEIQDLDVSEEQTDDLTGGAARRRKRERFGTDAAE